MRALVATFLTVVIAAGCSKQETGTSKFAVGGEKPPTIGLAHIPEFWQWLDENREFIEAHLKSDPSLAVARVTNEIKKIDGHLVAEFYPSKRPIEMIISADGMRDSILAVEQTVSAKPQDFPWKIVAFRQPDEALGNAEYGSAKLARDEVKFVVVNQGAKVDVRFYIEGVSSRDDEKASLIFLLLDSVIGEYNVMTKLGAIDVQPMANAPAGARPLNELPAAMGLK